MEFSGIDGHLLKVGVLVFSQLNDACSAECKPFVTLQYGTTKLLTGFSSDKGKNHKYNEQFVFSLIEGIYELIVQVSESDSHRTKHVLVGLGKLDLTEALCQGYEMPTLSLKSSSGSELGEVTLLLYYPNVKNPYGHLNTKMKSFFERMEANAVEKAKREAIKRAAVEKANAEAREGLERAAAERHQEINERAAKIISEKRERDEKAQREQAERNRFSKALDIEIKHWAAGKVGNIRALLSTMHNILEPEFGWQPVLLTDLTTGDSVKRAFRKATLCIHPDKVRLKGVNLQQKYIAERVFDLLKAAWNKFNSEEM